MNGTATRQSKRELRRAFGTEAVELIDRHAEQITLTAQIAGDLAQRIKVLEARCDDRARFHTVTHDRATHAFNHVTSLTFWGRLRWLVGW